MSLTVHTAPGLGCEDVVVATSGRHEASVYTGTDDGSILRIRHDGDRIERVARTGGRPLGIEIDGESRLLVADATRGLLRIDVDSGAVQVLADSVEGRRMKLVDNAAVALDGTVWFSDSSTHHDLDHWRADLVEDTRTGRLLRRDPDGGVDVVLDGLAFANGVVLSRGEDFVCVAETGARTIRRHWLAGPLVGTSDYLVRDLPGYPDNLSLGSDALIWVALASPTVSTLERLQRTPPAVRRLAARIPERIQPRVRPSVHVQAYDETGRLVHDLDLGIGEGPAARFHMVTGVREHDGRVWLGSLVGGAVAVVDL